MTSRDVTLPAGVDSIVTYSSEDDHGLMYSTPTKNVTYPLGKGPVPEDMRMFLMPGNRLVLVYNVEDGEFTDVVVH